MMHAFLDGHAEHMRQYASAQRRLTACRTELTEICADLVAQTRAIGRTMSEGAARMRGERR